MNIRRMAFLLIPMALAIMAAISISSVFAKMAEPNSVDLQQVNTEGAQAWKSTFSIGFIPDVGGIDDMGFNWLPYQGVLRAVDELGAVSTIYTPTSSTEYETKLQACVDGGNDICISVGFSLGQATRNVATSNPETKFAIVDAEANAPDNLRGILFDSKQSGYLAGTLAGLMTQSDIVGAVGGMEIPAVTNLVEGYANGARCSNASAEMIVVYAGTFIDPDLGAEIAQNMISLGADTIFAAAGLTGNGAVLTTTQSGYMGIGVDLDQYLTLFDNGSVEGSDKMLTSAMKRMDNAVFDTISDTISGAFTSGDVIYDAAVDGVGLAPYHEMDSFVSQDVRDAIELVRIGLSNGSISAYDNCRYIFLPLLIK